MRDRALKAVPKDEGIVWEDLPDVNKSKGRPEKWPSILGAVMARPNTWARIAQYKNSVGARSAAMRLRKTHDPLVWEFVSRGFRIYARYIGPANA
jgi:hypothetical protein